MWNSSKFKQYHSFNIFACIKQKEMAVWPKEKTLCPATSVFQSNATYLLPDDTDSSCSSLTLGTFLKGIDKREITQNRTRSNHHQ